MPLARLAPEDLDALYGRLLESGRRNASGDGPGLSPASVRYVHRILRKALGDAVRKGTLARNPASLADPPKRSTATRREGEMHVWSVVQLQTFLASGVPDVVEPDPRQPAATDDAVERAADDLGVRGRAVGTGEDEVVVVVAGAEPKPVSRLAGEGRSRA